MTIRFRSHDRYSRTRRCERWFLVLLVCCVASGVNSPAPSDSSHQLDHQTLLNSLVAIDSRFFGASETDALREGHERIDELKVCRRFSAEPHRFERCLLDGLLVNNSIRVAPDRSPPRASTASAALDGGPATCAAIVGVVLVLTEDLGDPFEAVILEKHVVLASRASPGRFFEALNRGTEITELDLRRHGSGPAAARRRVGGKLYVAYYLDNLAARLAEDGKTEEANRAFEDALEIAPHAPRVLYNYGSFLVARERLSEGLEYLNRAIDAGWDNASALVNRGVARWQLDDLDGARADFDHAIALDPSHHEARRNRRLLAQGAKPGIPPLESRN